MQEKIQAFIIKINNHNDNSKILTLYSNKLGKITVAANIPEKISNGNLGLYDLGNAVNVVLYRKTEEEMFKISEISLVKQYKNIHFNIDKMKVLYYILFVLNSNIEENFGDITLMNFLKLYMRFLNETNLDCKKTIFLFDFYFLMINGTNFNNYSSLSVIEQEFLKELSTQILLSDEFSPYITGNLIKQMNLYKKNKIKVLDISKYL